MLDPFVTLSVAASLTERVLLGTSTLVAPWYSPLLLARSLTGVDGERGPSHHRPRNRLVA
ncbi:hypothetical protein GCM10010330_78220 [Streptomyces tendae]|uniref:LLM class flavin-dependent oxidoreductase n=1 Tax=Streptomyces tendae TaxID=1932 RepID=UPI0019CF135E|nr:LLM class flavin-dependent oxidoreductase [Streptomyces tendae]GHB12498.1 hypothetical protein GCM10010330_78220 [Streptomyces tendae]